MATTYYPDFAKLSNYNPDSGVIAVRYAADAPLTEVELNEIQLIQNHRRKSLLKLLVGDGLTSGGSITFANGVLVIEDKHAFVDGYHVYIDSANITVADGQKVYLNVYENQLVGTNDVMKKYGNQGGEQIDNYIMDARYNQEISKRIVLCYELGTSVRAGAKALEIGTVVSATAGTMTYSYKTMGTIDNVVTTVETKLEEFSTSQQTKFDTFVSEIDTRMDQMSEQIGSASNSKEYLYENAKKITLTPAELAAKRDAGDFSGLEIGDYAEIVLEGDFAGTKIYAEIAGMDIYKGYSTKEKHSIDFVIRDILTKHRVNATNTNIGGWTSTELYTYLNTNVWNSIPQAWRNVIQPKGVLLENKAAADSTSWDWKWLNLWLLADQELFGYSSWSQKGYGNGNFKQYPLFRSERHLIKKYNGSAHWYWMLQPSVYGDKTTNWCDCGGHGYSDDLNAGLTVGGVVFGFRI